MTEFKIYHSKSELCKICNEREAIVLPLCEVDGENKIIPACKECVDKVPYQVIPIKTVMDEGYFWVNE